MKNEKMKIKNFMYVSNIDKKITKKIIGQASSLTYIHQGGCSTDRRVTDR